MYADLQATDGSERCLQNPDISLQQYRVELFFEKLYTIYTENACDGLVDLGDTTDDRSSIPVPVIDTVLAGLDRFPADSVNYKIIGNHEQYLRDTRVDVSRLFSGHFEVIRRKTIMLDGTAAVFASYPAEHDELSEWLMKEAARLSGKSKVLFGHFQAVGAAMNSGQALSGIPRTALERFNIALLGHVHLPQSLGSRVHYVGSPFQQNWGEANQNKRVGILDTDTLKVEWVPMIGFPVYKQADLAGFKAGFDGASEDRWKIALNTRDEAEHFYATPHAANFEALHAYTTTADTTSNLPGSASTSPAELLRQWMDLCPPPEAGVDPEITPEDLIGVGKQLIGEAEPEVAHA